MVDTVQSTIIGPSIVIRANLQGDEDLTVLGRVEGTINLTKTVNVAESGVVKADLTVRNAIVSGVVVGNITASDSVEITEAGRMVGDIRAPRVIIVDGARFRGTVDMGDLDAPRASGPLPARTVSSRNAPVSKVALPTRGAPAKGKATPVPTPPRPVPSKTAPPVTKPGAPAKPAEQVTVPAAPIAAKKKIKKKVVVKKKGD
jgi:cytoskeletal protein CcmA (bactofilin family)